MFINRHKKPISVLCKILFALYILVLVYFLFFAEVLGRADAGRTFHYNLIPFKEINRFLEYGIELGFITVFLNLAGNILIFIPFGFLIPIMSRKLKGLFYVAVLSFGLSLMVELLQLVTRVGSFDVDDLMLNTLGGCIGFAIYIVVQVIRDKNADRYRIKHHLKIGELPPGKKR